MKIYLAGPDVFLPDAIDIGRRKVAICASYGLTGLYPLDNEVDRSAGEVPRNIFKGCEAMMDAADAIIANLTPFRGPGADPGTTYELGYMAARGKLCLGYCNDPTIYVDRVRQFTDVHPQDGRLIDAEGLTVEDFGLYLARFHRVRGLRAPGGRTHCLALVPREACPLPASAPIFCWSNAACSRAGRGHRRRSKRASSPPTTSRSQKHPRPLPLTRTCRRSPRTPLSRAAG